MSNGKMFTLIGVLLVLFIVYLSTFIVTEKDLAIRFAVGKFEKSDFEPGLHFKIPFYHRVQIFDKRILTFDAPPQTYLTKEGNPLNVDYYIKWRINDVEAFYRKMGGQEGNAVNRFNAIVNKGLLDAFGKRTEWEVISEDRAEVMSKITETARALVNPFGIKIVDVRTKRIELPQSTFQKIFERMRSDRLKLANEQRASGKGEGNRIRAEAEKERKILLAEGYNQSQQLRGSGDAKAAEIYAKAFNKNSEFYGFYRSLEAYRKTFENPGSKLVIEPDSEFFRYFKQPKLGK